MSSRSFSESEITKCHGGRDDSIRWLLQVGALGLCFADNQGQLVFLQCIAAMLVVPVP